MNVSIIVRSSPDYQKIRDKNCFRNQLSEPYKPKLELELLLNNNIFDVWNKFFSIDFFSYRKSIVEIAKDNLKNTDCKILKEYTEYCRWYKYDTEDSILVPVDDDDWFSPQLKDIANHFDDQTDVVVWPEVVFYSTTNHYCNISKNYKFGSNNWAVKKSFLKKLDAKTARHLVLLSHKHTENFMKYNVSENRIKKLNNFYSVHIKHLGGLNFLKNLIQLNNFETDIKKIYLDKIYLNKSYFNKELEWTDPFVNKVFELNRKIRNKIKIL
jgi:hypothetical protein